MLGDEGSGTFIVKFPNLINSIDLSVQSANLSDACVSLYIAAYWISHYCMKKYVDHVENLNKCPHSVDLVKRLIFEHFEVCLFQQTSDLGPVPYALNSMYCSI